MADYQATIDYLFTQLPMYQRAGASAMKKDLTNIRVLLDWLGNPHQDLRCIHVAGTNGKGTVSHLLSAALQAHGYSVGTYTSPHYKDFRERIKIGKTLISETAVINFVDRLKAAKLDIQPSFFEITVAMAFDYFAQQAPDWCVIEVGLGGRLDSTNVITPALSVITNIGFDHMQFLGDTLPLIAGEKAGIIKTGIPVVIGETHPETETVFRDKARQERAPIVFADQAYRINTLRAEEGDLDNQYSIGMPNLDRELKITTDLSGPHLAKNLLTAYAALLALYGKGLLPNGEAILAGWRKVARTTYYLGRWQVLRAAGPRAIADSAHNAEGLGPVIDRLVSLNKPLHIVLGVVNDKDLSKALPLFPTEAKYYFVKADIPRGLAAEQLQLAGKAYDLIGEAYPSVAAGYAAALSAAGADDLVFVGGSIFTVAEVLQ
jgi:dihydrofolate synthase/folylpolyglutamate synthase